MNDGARLAARALTQEIAGASGKTGGDVTAGAPRGQPVIAIDGPVGAGKSTVARTVARRLGYRYVNTGAMYRAVAHQALRRSVSLEDPSGLAEIARSLKLEFRETPHGQRVIIQGTDVTDALMAPAVSEGASLVSAYPSVREALVRAQRRLGEGGGVVVEGRDIGTVVFPDADVKVFLSASQEERARRRYRELRGKGIEVEFPALRDAEEARDRRDVERTHSPLRVAADAVVIDTTDRSPEEVVEEVLGLVRNRAVG